MRDTNGPLPDTDFWRAYCGKFAGILGWPEFDVLWGKLAASDGAWWVFNPSGDAPDQPQTGATFATTLDEARVCVEQMRGRSYCGAVYVDDANHPGFVKVFDPYKMGGVCGSTGERILPRWIFSRRQPDALPLIPEAPGKKGFFARIVG